MKFPVFKTKVKGLNKKFDLTDPEQEKEYFELKAGKEIEKLREFLKENSFVAYFWERKILEKELIQKCFQELSLQRE